MAGTPLTGKAGWLTGLTDWLLVGLQVCPKLQVQVLQVYVSLGLTGLTGWWGVDSPCFYLFFYFTILSFLLDHPAA